MIELMEAKKAVSKQGRMTKGRCFFFEAMRLTD